MGLFDVFKDKDEDENSGGMAEETPSFESEPEPEETPSFESEPKPEETPSTEPAEETTSYSQPAEETPSTEPAEETTSYSQAGTAMQSQLGIEGLMDKRFKLGEAIDYVGYMIKELRDKRTGLVKSIEEESVDIKNLKEKLTKINQDRKSTRLNSSHT